MRKKNPGLIQSLVDSIENFYYSQQRMPSVYELAEMTGSAKSTVHRYLVDMDGQGIISYKNGRIMTDRIETMYHSVRNCPVVGSIPCGTPDEREQLIERYIPLPTELFGDGKIYLLRASGDSMIDAGIEAGDYVVIRSQDSAETGDIVAALIDGTESTLKRLKWDPVRQGHYLHPENPSYDDMYFDTIRIQGVAISVIKKL
mgnify:CR=1 FL=1